jgi:small-conductance mechanosensitive channel
MKTIKRIEQIFKYYMVLYYALFYVFILRIIAKYGQLPIGGPKHDIDFPGHHSILSHLVRVNEFVFIILIILNLFVLVKWKMLNKTITILFSLLLIHFIIDPFLVWFVD